MCHLLRLFSNHAVLSLHAQLLALLPALKLPWYVALHIIKCIHLTSNVSLMTLHVTLVVLKSCKVQMADHKYKVANSGSRAIYIYA